METTQGAEGERLSVPSCTQPSPPHSPMTPHLSPHQAAPSQSNRLTIQSPQKAHPHAGTAPLTPTHQLKHIHSRAVPSASPWHADLDALTHVDTMHIHSHHRHLGHSHSLAETDTQVHPLRLTLVYTGLDPRYT